MKNVASLPKELQDELNLNLQVVGKNIRELRRHRGITQAELARNLGLEQNAISQYENGTIDISLSRLMVIAAQLGCTYQSLLPRDPSAMIAPAVALMQETGEEQKRSIERLVASMVDTVVDQKLSRFNLDALKINHE